MDNLDILRRNVAAHPRGAFAGTLASQLGPAELSEAQKAGTQDMARRVAKLELLVSQDGEPRHFLDRGDGSETSEAYVRYGVSGTA